MFKLTWPRPARQPIEGDGSRDETRMFFCSCTLIIMMWKPPSLESYVACSKLSMLIYCSIWYIFSSEDDDYSQEISDKEKYAR